MNRPRIVVAYDATPNATDALALGRALAAQADAHLELAHVHPIVAVRPGGEASAAAREAFLGRHSAELLAEGAASAELTDAAVHAIGATTTATGLRELAEREDIDLLVFGSAHGTAPGSVRPGSASRRLLQNGPTAIAFAPAGYAADGSNREPVVVTSPGERINVDPAADRAIRTASAPVIVVPAGEHPFARVPAGV